MPLKESFVQPWLYYIWYLADVYDEDEDDEDEEDAHDGPPDWVESEREQFKAHRDKDKDGKLNAEEVREWIIPEDYDHSESEAQHLVFTADENKVCFHWCDLRILPLTF